MKIDLIDSRSSHMPALRNPEGLYILHISFITEFKDEYKCGLEDCYALVEWRSIINIKEGDLYKINFYPNTENITIADTHGFGLQHRKKIEGPGALYGDYVHIDTTLIGWSHIKKWGYLG